jgi:1-pyrroline-5-carboxylate dehydrogenase
MGLVPYKNEEYLDWSDEKNVEAMLAALKKVGDELGKSYPAVIGGKPVEIPDFKSGRGKGDAR